MKRYFFEKISC